MPLENPGLVIAVRHRHGQVANNLREAMIYRSVLASLCVEAFSLERLRKLSMDEIHQRYEMFKTMSQFELPE
jgi:hypothetical protein